MEKGSLFMRMNFKRCVWVLAVAVGIAIGGGTVQAVGQDRGQDYSNSDRDQQGGREGRPDYSKNKTYQQGMREGRDDHARNRDHFKKRHFKRDQDQKAYESGYQDGHGRR
jgi:hypothetical protein